jgi:hypothetical protein
MGLVDWDMRNAHPEFLLRVCARHGVPSKLFTDYVGDCDTWYALFLETVSGDPVRRTNSDAKKVTRADAKKLFIRLLYQGSSGPWYKEHHFESNIREKEKFKAEIKRIGKRIVREYPSLHKAAKAMSRDAERFRRRTPSPARSPLSLGDIVLASWPPPRTSRPWV